MNFSDQFRASYAAAFEAHRVRRETFLARIARLDCFRAAPKSGAGSGSPDSGKQRGRRAAKIPLRRDGTMNDGEKHER